MRSVILSNLFHFVLFYKNNLGSHNIIIESLYCEQTLTPLQADKNIGVFGVTSFSCFTKTSCRSKSWPTETNTHAMTKHAMNNFIIRNETLCGLLNVHRCFGGTYCLHPQGLRESQTAACFLLVTFSAPRLP
jgi:hypothetical protein